MVADGCHPSSYNNTVLQLNIEYMYVDVCVCVCVYAVIKNSIASCGQAMNIDERRMMSSVREMFLIFVLIFYIW